jgi:carboxypeptidase family protein/TonB-dependent receptor-like protein
MRPVTIRRMAAWLFVMFLLEGRSAAAQRPPDLAITGVVVDTTGGALPRAAVQLTDGAGAAVQSLVTDPIGAFRFERVPPGRYDIRVTSDGFRPTTVRITVGTRAQSPVRITLPLAGVTQEITVSNSAPQVNADAAANSDAVTVDQDMLDSLPVFDQNAVAALSRFLDTGSIGTSGVTIVVNGMEVNGLNVSASAVQQIKINQDPYSAEYSRPGRGRIEILTKPGAQTYHAEGNVILRDSQLNARNPFADVRPPEQRRIFEGFLGGPVGHGGKSSFMLSADADADNQQAIVFALGKSGIIRDAVPQPNHHLLLSGSVTRQLSETTTISVRPSYEDVTNRNRGVGGVTLASAGTNFEHREEQITYTQQTIVNPALVNQFQFLVGQEREPTTSVSPDRGIVVDGAFTGGGAQSDLLRTERHFQLTDSLTLTKGRHLAQAGFQVPDWSWRGFDDHTNAGGTFYFSDLGAYSAGRPYSFIEQQGNGHLVLLEKVLGLYLKDDWQMQPGLTLSLGLRYDWANYFRDNDNLAPRFSVAYAPGRSKTDVIRAGAGMFYDKIGPVPGADVMLSRPGGLRRVVLVNPNYPDPFQSAAGVLTQPQSIVQFAPNIQIPSTLQYSLGVEHQLLKGTTVAVTYTGSRSHDLFRSRDVNAPLPPLYLGRPDPAYGVIRQIESAGRQRSDGVQVTLRGKVTRWFNGQMQYALSRTYNDTGGLSWFPSNDYDLSGEWARADFDRRHRFALLGRINPGRFLDLGAAVTLQSGAPYSETLGADIFNNGRGSARPGGVPRNSLEGAGYADMDLRASRDVTFAKGTPQARTVTLGLDAFNIVNRVNHASYVGTLTSPLFGQPVTARAPRQLQVSARIKF